MMIFTYNEVFYYTVAPLLVIFVQAMIVLWFYCRNKDIYRTMREYEREYLKLKFGEEEKS